MSISKLYDVQEYLQFLAKAVDYEADFRSDTIDGGELESLSYYTGKHEKYAGVMKEVDQEGGEGEGEYYHVVYSIKHPVHGEVFLKTTGQYDSWNGVDWEYGTISLCTLQPVTTMQYVDSKDESVTPSVYEEVRKYLDFSDTSMRNWLLGILRDSTIVLEFTKSDNTQRVMKCTLKSDLIPKDDSPVSGIKRAESNTAFRVYDLEKKDWRSVRWAYINKMHIEV